MPLATRDSWFNPPGIIDIASGRITSVWLPDGRVLSLALGIRATMWKFTPETVAK